MKNIKNIKYIKIIKNIKNIEEALPHTFVIDKDIDTLL
jgi:hypothetical protein